MATPKIAVYSLPGTVPSYPSPSLPNCPTNLVPPTPDLKNTTDDALPNYLTSLKFKQSHFLTDVRLALGYSAVTISAITFYFDYQHGWEATKAYTLWAVLSYFLLNSALTYWIWGVERGTVFVGDRAGTQVWLDQAGMGRVGGCEYACADDACSCPSPPA